MRVEPRGSRDATQLRPRQFGQVREGFGPAVYQSLNPPPRSEDPADAAFHLGLGHDTGEAPVQNRR